MENLMIYKDEKSMNIQPTIEYMKSIPRRPLNRIYCPECNRILCPATDKCICGQIIKWVGGITNNDKTRKIDTIRN